MIKYIKSSTERTLRTGTFTIALDTVYVFAISSILLSSLPKCPILCRESMILMRGVELFV